MNNRLYDEFASWFHLLTRPGDYADGRHPASVQFSDPEQDAQRRDFTINGMFYDPVEQKVIDYVGGKRDLKRRVIRAIGEPARRFSEDHLRMLRAVRFAARLCFDLDPPTAAAICATAQEITMISTERIRMELVMILTEANRRRGWELLHLTGLGRTRGLPRVYAVAPTRFRLLTDRDGARTREERDYTKHFH